jgi:hypothetical protein
MEVGHRCAWPNAGLRTDTLIWSEFAARAWTGGLLIQAAAKNVGWMATDTVTSADFVKGLHRCPNETMGGVCPTLNLTAVKPHPVDCWCVRSVHGGVATQILREICHTGS